MRMSTLLLGTAIAALVTGCSRAEPDDPGPAASPATATQAGAPSVPATDDRQAFDGDFDGMPVRFSFQVGSDGTSVRGTLEGLDEPLSFEGSKRAGVLTGRLDSEDESIPATGLLAGDLLQLDIGPDPESPDDIVSLLLQRVRVTAAATLPYADPEQVLGPASTTVVNGQPIPEPVKQALAQMYMLRIGAGTFWYDRVSGAWGVQGGPTVGYIVPGLELGGPLDPDASGGGTAVTINGRVLHPFDLLGLQALVGPVAPGRYFLDPQSNIGLEGGPPLLNLIALASVLQQQQRQALYGPGWDGGRGPPAGGYEGGGVAGGGDQFWSSGITGAAGNESGGAGYVMVDGVSATYGM